MDDFDAKFGKANFTDKVFGGITTGIGVFFVGGPAMIARAAYSFFTDEDPASRDAAINNIVESVSSASFDIGKDVVKSGTVSVLAAILGANINRRS